MKYFFSLFAIIICSAFIFGQNKESSDFTEKNIESGSTYKKYKNGKLDSIIVSMYAVNYGNALLFSKLDDKIRITNASDENSVITIQLKNKKQIKTLLYKNKPLIVIENIDFDINNLPKNTIVSSGIYNQIIANCTVMTNYDLLGNDNPDKKIKLFHGLNIQSDLDNLDAIFENIGDFFSEKDALLKFFYGSYGEKFAPQALAYLKTDNLGKIEDGIFLDFKNKKNSEKNKYNVYKNGKIIKSGAANLNNFQKIFVDYREKSEDN